MKILIKVTKEVLKRSMFCSGTSINENCAIALAVRDLFPRATVGASFINSLAEQIELPDSAIRFIYKFDSKTPDQRLQMHPLSFEVDVPDSVINEVGISEAYRILSESKTLELVQP